jgi:beta-N-acetylhexosaminidase
MIARAAKQNQFLAMAVVLLLIVAGWGIYQHSSEPNSSLSAPAGAQSSLSSSAASSLPSAVSAFPSDKETQSTAASEQTKDEGNPVITGVFSDYSAVAQKKLASLTLKEKVGQVFLFRCPQSNSAEAVQEYQPGGYFLMAVNFKDKTKQQVQSMLRSYQNASKTKMILSCDEEGGTVVRISKYPALAKSPFQSPQQVFQRFGMDGIYSDTVKKVLLLQELGFNLNLAPVCDVSTNVSDFMYERSFGKNAKETAGFVETSVKAYSSRNFSCTLKHFPGYGNNADTHTGIAYDKRSYSTFQTADFLPFQAGIQAGAPCVMVSHNIVSSMDAKNPASLSPKVHDILRKELGFTGIVMTDDLSMEAITDYTGGKNPSAAAFTAGNDMLLSTNIAEDFNALYAAVQNGDISKQRLDESVLRILAWKYKMGII